MIYGFAAAFAFFTGLALTITWGAQSSAQSAVEDLTAKFAQVGWAINNLNDAEARAVLGDRLDTYLRDVVEDDAPQLATGATDEMPWALSQTPRHAHFASGISSDRR